MKCYLGISNNLEKTSSLSQCIVFLYFFALITEEGFLIFPCYSSELCIQMSVSFIFFSAIGRLEVRNRFMGLDLIDRVSEELWTEVRDIVQEAVIKTIPKRKKCKKAKWLSEESLQIAVKRKEVKSKGEKER